MPVSSWSGKSYSVLMLRKLHEAGLIETVLDIATGRGTYSNLLREALAGTTWTGIEAYPPYVEAFGLEGRYDRLIVQDARTVDYEALGPVDLAILGDVLEHMTEEEAVALMDRVSSVAHVALISIPITHAPHGPMFGNPYEVHVKDDWSHAQVMDAFPNIVTAFVHNEIGVYILTRDPDLAGAITALHRAIAPMVHAQAPEDTMRWSQ